MVEILQKPKGYVITCDRCKSILMFQLGDMINEDLNKTSITGCFSYIKCPVCKKRIDLYDNFKRIWLNNVQEIYPDPEGEEI